MSALGNYSWQTCSDSWTDFQLRHCDFYPPPHDELKWCSFLSNPVYFDYPLSWVDVPVPFPVEKFSIEFRRTNTDTFVLYEDNISAKQTKAVVTLPPATYEFQVNFTLIRFFPEAVAKTFVLMQEKMEPGETSCPKAFLFSFSFCWIQTQSWQGKLF